MTKFIKILFLLLLVNFTAFSQTKPVIVMHGGAGTITKKNLSPEMEQQYRLKMNEALQAGYDTLLKGADAMTGAITAIKILENSPLFNAGKGAVFTNDGRNELDASVMDGKTLKAGAVAGVKRIKNPITAARAVMDQSPHVMMTGKGAEQFASSKGIEMVDSSYFFDEKRWKQLQKLKEQETEQLKKDTSGLFPVFRDEKFGTVGAVVLDSYGNLAASTSTGGMNNKRFGRVGDSPIIGAGTYADNGSCAVSATGHGEYFIRYVVAYDIAALVKYKKLTVKQASEEVINNKLKAAGGEGGVIVLDGKGNIAMPFNTEGMYRGYINAKGEKKTFIYREE